MAEQALALAPDLAEAHVAQGLFYYYGFREYEQALTEFGRALQLQPNNVQALEFFGFCLSPAGSMGTLFGHAEKSIEQDPRNPDVQEAWLRLMSFCACGKKPSAAENMH